MFRKYLEDLGILSARNKQIAEITEKKKEMDNEINTLSEKKEDSECDGELNISREKLRRSIRDLISTYIEKGDGYLVIGMIEKFRGLITKEEIARGIISYEYREIKQCTKEEFERIPKEEVINTLCDNGKACVVMSHLGAFDASVYESIKKAIIKSDRCSDLLDHPDNFKNIDYEELLEYAIKHNYLFPILKHLELFKLENHQRLALLLIEEHPKWFEQFFDKLKLTNHQEIADKLLEKEEGEVLATILPKFTDLNHQEYIIKIAKITRWSNKGLAYAISHLDEYTNVDHVELAEILTDRDQYQILLENYNKFHGVDTNMVYKRSIAHKNANNVAKYVNNLSDVNKMDIANTLIDEKYAYELIQNFENFTDLDRSVIIQRIIDTNQVYAFIERKDDFPEINQEFIVSHSIHEEDNSHSSGSYHLLLNIENFDSSFHKRIVFSEIEKGHHSYVLERLNKVDKSLHKEIFIKVIEHNGGKLVIENISKCKELGSDELANLLINNKQEWLLLEYYEQFPGINILDTLNLAIERKSNKPDFEKIFTLLNGVPDINYPQIIEKLFEYDYGKSVLKYACYIKGIDFNLIADLAVKKGLSYELPEYFNNLEGADQKKYSKAILDDGYSWALTAHLENFPDLDHADLADELLTKGHGKELANRYEKFTGLANSQIAERLLANEDSAEALANNIDKFPDVDHVFIAKELIKIHCADALAQNIKKFHGLDIHEIVHLLFESGQEESIGYFIFDFAELNYKELMTKLIETGKTKTLKENRELGDHIDTDIALLMAQNELGWQLIKEVHYGSELVDCKRVLFEFIKQGNNECAGGIFNKVAGLTKNDIQEFISIGGGWLVGARLGSFKDADPQETAEILINAGQGAAVAENINYYPFEKLEPLYIAHRLLETHQEKALADNLRYFKELDSDVVLALIKNGFAVQVDECYHSVWEPFKKELRDEYEQSKQPLSFSEHILCINSKEDFKMSRENSEEWFKKAFEKFDNENIGEWMDKELVSSVFRQGAEIFGYKKMFQFVHRGGLKKHDALFAFQKIIDLFKISNIKSEQFYSNILSQVSMDDQKYPEGTAHHHLNAIIQSLDLDFDKVITEATKSKELIKMNELLEHFSDKKLIVNSWNSLIKYSNLVELLNRKELISKLESLQTQGKIALMRFTESLAFHPTCKIDMKDALMFCDNPDEFLELSDTHTREEIHNRKKPSNYINIPHLDLTAVELRDALVEGDLDTLQAFQPLEINYIYFPEAEGKSISELLKVALGSRKNKIPGKAENSDKLFFELTKLFKENDLHLQGILEGTEKIPENSILLQNILTKVFNPEYGIKSKPETYTARVNLKSNPEGVLAGNDTACCMPFGSGKNNIYMFNPDTSQFTLQISQHDQTKRTIAQSVLTKDKNVQIPIPELMGIMNEDGKHMNDVFNDMLLQSSQYYLSADNVEVAHNYQNDKYSKIIEIIYRDFFKEYFTRYAKQEQLYPQYVLIGQGYSDSLNNLPQISNTYAPAAPLGYSDKTGPNVYKLEILQENQNSVQMLKNIKTSIKPENNSYEYLPPFKEVSHLTFLDTLSVAYLEGKAYSSNKSLMVYLHNLENALIAKDINNAAKKRPNMSFKYEDTAGKTRAYLLAYEGKYNLHTGDTPDTQKEILYVADLASDPSSKMAGGKLIEVFIDAYKKNYIERNKLLPIFGEFRDSTSYKILNKQIQRLGEKFGITFTIEEKETYEENGETMHPVFIVPQVKTQKMVNFSHL